MIDPTEGDDSIVPIGPADRLRASWEADAPVRLEEFLDDWPGLPPIELAELITLDQDERWRRSERIAAESYFLRFPALNDDLEAALWVVYGEVLAAIHDGLKPELVDYQSRFPFLKEMIALQWEVHEAFQTDLDTETLDFSDSDRLKPEPEGYEVFEEIGRGALGVVHRARHRRLDRIVALKMLREAPLLEPEAFLRFFEEARLMAKLEHSRIVRVLDFGRHEGWPYIALELIEGQSLDERLSGQVMAPKESARLIAAVTEGVRFAHENQITHRDLKPANILIDKHGEPKITDFGVAKQGVEGLAVTRTGELIGTPAYMSPEQARCLKTIGPTTDLYSLGAILYEMLTGRPPLLAPSFAETVLLVIRQTPVSPDQVNILVPADLAAICMKCLEKDPLRRYASAEELRRDLQRFLDGERTLARPANSAAKILRWSRANPLPSLLAGAFLGAILLGLASTSSFAYWASIRERDARTAETKAKESLAIAGLARADEATALTKTEQALDRAEWLVYAGILERTYRHVGEKDFEATNAMLNAARWDFRGPEFALVSNLSRLQGKQLHGHELAIRTIAFGPDGQTLVSGSDDRTVRLWNPDSQLHIDTYRSERGQVGAVCYEPEGRRVVIGDESGTLTVHDFAAKKTVQSWRGGTAPIRQLIGGPLPDQRISRDADGAVVLWKGDQRVREFTNGKAGVIAIDADASRKRIAIANRDGMIRVVEIETGKAIFSIAEPSDGLRTLALSPDGQTVVAAGDDPLIRSWDVGAATPARVFAGHSARVSAMVFHPDGNALASGSADGSVRLWDLKTAVGQLVLKSHHGAITALAFRRDGELAAGSEDASLILLDPSRDAGILRVPTTTRDQLQLAFHPDGRSIASPNPEGGFDLWDLENGRLKGTFRASIQPGHAVCFTPDGLEMITSGEDEAITVWNIAESKAARTIPNARGWVFALAHHPERPEIVAAMGGGVVVTFDTRTGEPVKTFKGHTESVLATAYTPDGRRIVTASFDASVRVWDRETGQELLTISPLQPAIRLAISPDGQRLLTSTWGDTFDIWSLRNGRNLGRISGHGKTVTGVAFSSDGQRIISCSNDGTVRFLHSRLFTELLDVQVGSKVTQLAISPDGGRLAASSSNGLLRIWNTACDEPISTIYPNAGPVATAAFRADGKQFAIVTRSGVGQLWNALSGRIETLLTEHQGAIETASYSKNGKVLATGGSNGIIAVWNPQIGRVIATLGDGGSAIHRLAFDPTGKQLAVIREGGGVEVWDWEVNALRNTAKARLDLPCHDLVWSPDGGWISQVTMDGKLIQTKAASGQSMTWLVPDKVVRKVVWGEKASLGRLFGLTADGTIVSWNVENGQVLRQWKAHSEADRALSLSPDGSRILSGGMENAMKVWRADSGALEYEIPCFSASVLDVAFSPDGQRILSGSEDTTAKMIELAPARNLAVYRR